MSRETKSIYQKKGRYNKGGTTTEYSDRLGWWERSNMTQSDTDITYILSSRLEGRPDLIAYTIYGNAYYWWVVMQYNHIVDPVTELVKGKAIVLPTPTRLKNVIGV